MQDMRVFTSFYLREGNRCTGCQKQLDGVTNVQGLLDEPFNEGAKPRAGDWTVCSYCGAILVFGADLKIRRPTDGELQEFQRRQPDSFELVAKAAVHFSQGRPRQ
jgi:hypothetical protein